VGDLSGERDIKDMMTMSISPFGHMKAVGDLLGRRDLKDTQSNDPS
jgi:hypothetical protein